jgi:hypothetical protein
MPLPPEVREPAIAEVERYDETDPAPDVRPLLAAIEADVTAIFWG